MAIWQNHSFEVAARKNFCYPDDCCRRWWSHTRWQEIGYEILFFNSLYVNCFWIKLQIIINFNFWFNFNCKFKKMLSHLLGQYISSYSWLMKNDNKESLFGTKAICVNLYFIRTQIAHPKDHFFINIYFVQGANLKILDSCIHLKIESLPLLRLLGRG